MNLGLRIISTLKNIAEINRCYKVILDCEEKNVGFYEKVRLFGILSLLEWI